MYSKFSYINRRKKVIFGCQYALTTVCLSTEKYGGKLMAWPNSLHHKFVKPCI